MNAEDGYQLWSQVFDRELTDVFAIQEEIAQAIVSALKDQFGLDPAANVLIEPGTENLEAYNSYLRARHRLGSIDPESVQQAIHDLEQAVAADPEFADAWGALAWSWSQLSCWLPFDETAQPMKQAFDRTLSLAPKHPAGLSSKAWYTVRTEWDWRAAEELFSIPIPRGIFWPLGGSIAPSRFCAKRWPPTPTTCTWGRSWPGTSWSTDVHRRH